MKNIGVSILSRYNSKRLEGKALIEINGKKLLSHIVDKINYDIPDIETYITTSKNSSDDIIIEYCKRNNHKHFRGSLDNVASRLLDCGIENNWDYIIRINGDNLFIDTSSLKSMISIAQTKEFDFISNVPGRTFPYGMSIEIIKTDFLKNIINQFDKHDREHVTSWLYRNESIGSRYILNNKYYPLLSNLKLSIDSNEDIILAEKIFSYFPNRNNIDIQDLNFVHKNFNLLDTNNKKDKFWIGKHGPMLIAEIGGNHEGSFTEAKKLLKLAIDSGVDCVKFQLYSGDSLVNKKQSPERNKHFKKFELTKEEHIELAQICHKKGIVYNASVWDINMLEWIDEYLTFYKIGSGDLTSWPIIEEFVKREKPILISTGLSSFNEVNETVKHIQRLNNKYFEPNMLCIMQCTSMYPINNQDANLEVINVFRKRFNYPIGYSDHTIGFQALLAAATINANVLEFHFTDVREGKSFRDHEVSLTNNEVKDLIKKIILKNSYFGNGEKKLLKIEKSNHHHVSFRRAVYSNRFISKGEIISKEDLVLLRPLTGTDPRDISSLINSIAIKDINAYEPILKNEHYD
jgi:sialic acid synthase SpsE/spore coat polysaccharide biosynthesis protein SpsF (cytidylyltransferase family)